MGAVLDEPKAAPQLFVMPAGDSGDPVWFYPHGRAGEKAIAWIMRRDERSVTVQYFHPRGGTQLGFEANVIHKDDPRTLQKNRSDNTWEHRETTTEKLLRAEIAALKTPAPWEPETAPAPTKGKK